MSLLKDTKAETTPANPILKKVTLKIILGKFKKYPKKYALSVTSSVFPGMPSRRREKKPRRKIKHGTQGDQK